MRVLLMILVVLSSSCGHSPANTQPRDLDAFHEAYFETEDKYLVVRLLSQAASCVPASASESAYFNAALKITLGATTAGSYALTASEPPEVGEAYVVFKDGGGPGTNAPGEAPHTVAFSEGTVTIDMYENTVSGHFELVVPAGADYDYVNTGDFSAGPCVQSAYPSPI